MDRVDLNMFCYVYTADLSMLRPPPVCVSAATALTLNTACVRFSADRVY